MEKIIERTDELIRQDGMEALSKSLGLVDAARFISLVNKEKFDYTEWRKDKFDNMSLEEYANAADEYSKKNC